MAGRPPGRTEKGDLQRDHLFTVAMEAFATRGYDATTLRGLARDAGVSPGLMYKYFPSKAALVMELYRRLTVDFEAQVAELSVAGWYARSVATLRSSLEVLQPHRGVLRATLQVLLLDEELGLFSPSGSDSRRRVRGCFERAVQTASDAPGEGWNGLLARLMDWVQLLCILLLCIDRSEGQAATWRLVALVETLERPARAALWLPGARGILDTVDGVLEAATALPRPA